MIFDRFAVQNDILGSAMQAAVLRNDIINNNIANGDTPGYKKKAVDFEVQLSKAIELSKSTGKLDLSNVKPSIRVEHGSYEYRLDGNNVDPESEMVDLYANQVRYDALANALISNYKRINLAFQIK